MPCSDDLPHLESDGFQASDAAGVETADPIINIPQQSPEHQPSQLPPAAQVSKVLEDKV